MARKASASADSDSERSSVMQDFAPYLSLGAQICSAVVISGGIGWWIDTLFNSDPIFLIISLLFGIISGMTMFIRAALRADKKVT